MYHSLLIQSSIDGRLGYLHILIIVNNAAMNIGMHISFQISVLPTLDKYLEVLLLGHMTALFLSF